MAENIPLNVDTQLGDRSANPPGSKTFRQVLAELASDGHDDYLGPLENQVDPSALRSATAPYGSTLFHRVDVDGTNNQAITILPDSNRLDPDSIGPIVRPTKKISDATRLLVDRFINDSRKPGDHKSVKALAKGFGYLLFGGDEPRNGIIHVGPMLDAFPISVGESIREASNKSRGSQSSEKNDAAAAVLAAIRLAGKEHTGSFECSAETYKLLFHAASVGQGEHPAAARELIAGLFEGHQRNTVLYAHEYAKAAVALGQVAIGMDVLNFGLHTLMFKNGVLDRENGGRRLSAYVNTAVDDPQIMHVLTALESVISLGKRLRVGDRSDVLAQQRDEYYRRELGRVKDALAINDIGVGRRAELINQYNATAVRLEGPAGAVDELLERPDVIKLDPSDGEIELLRNLEARYPEAEVKDLMWGFRLSKYSQEYCKKLITDMLQNPEYATSVEQAISPSGLDLNSLGNVSYCFRAAFSPGLIVEVYSLGRAPQLKNLSRQNARAALEDIMLDQRSFADLKSRSISVVDIRRRRSYGSTDELFSEPVFSVFPGVEDKDAPIPLAMVLRPATDMEGIHTQTFEFPVHIDIPLFRHGGTATDLAVDLQSIHEQQRQEVFEDTNRWPGRYGIEVPLEHEQFTAAGLSMVTARAVKNGLTRVSFVSRSGDEIVFYQDRRLTPYAAMDGNIDLEVLYGLNFWALRAMREYLSFIPEDRDLRPDVARRIGPAIKNFDPMPVFTRSSDDGSPGVPNQRQIEIFISDNPGMTEEDFWKIYYRRMEADTQGRGSTWRSGYETVIDRKPTRIPPPDDMFSVLD